MSMLLCWIDRWWSGVNVRGKGVRRRRDGIERKMSVFGDTSKRSERFYARNV